MVLNILLIFESGSISCCSNMVVVVLWLQYKYGIIMVGIKIIMMCKKQNFNETITNLHKIVFYFIFGIFYKFFKNKSNTIL